MNESTDMAKIRELSNSAIEMMRLYRHDVMNDFQLIRGFLQLNKLERVNTCIQHAVERAQKMSVFSDLPDALVGFVLTEAYIRFSLLDLELTTELPTPTKKRSATDLATSMYEPALIFQLRDVLTQLGTFATKKNMNIYIDIDFSSADSIRIHVSGNNENMDWEKELVSFPILRTIEPCTIHNRTERMDSGFILTIQNEIDRKEN
jgi:sensor histidine kinase regulating citrate/malate metabolism